MPEENLCPIHGPYPASYSSCPRCAGQSNFNRPTAPRPLDEDDMPTDLGGNGVRSGSAPDRGESEEDMPTDLGKSRRSAPGGGRRSLDPEEDEQTSLGKMGRDIDETELDAQDTSMIAILWVKEGRRRGKIYKIKNGDVIGRKDGDLILDDPKISQPHARFTVEGEQFVVWDFGSKNGTFVNGERIRAATPLKENDVIRLGDNTFVLKVLV